MFDKIDPKFYIDNRGAFEFEREQLIKQIDLATQTFFRLGFRFDYENKKWVGVTVQQWADEPPSEIKIKLSGSESIYWKNTDGNKNYKPLAISSAISETGMAEFVNELPNVYKYLYTIIYNDIENARKAIRAYYDTVAKVSYSSERKKLLTQDRKKDKSPDNNSVEAENKVYNTYAQLAVQYGKEVIAELLKLDKLRFTIEDQAGKRPLLDVRLTDGYQEISVYLYDPSERVGQQYLVRNHKLCIDDLDDKYNTFENRRDNERTIYAFLKLLPEIKQALTKELNASDVLESLKFGKGRG